MIEAMHMQSIESVTNVVLILVSALFGGLITGYAIRALEIKEREREGDFSALIFLREAAEHVALGEKYGLAAIGNKEWRYRQERIVNGLIQSAARCQKNYRKVLYNAAKKLTRTRLEDTSFSLSSSDILTLIEEMEAEYFR